MSVVGGVGFSEHSSEYTHDSEHSFRIVIECEHCRVLMKSFKELNAILSLSNSVPAAGIITRCSKLFMREERKESRPGPPH